MASKNLKIAFIGTGIMGAPIAGHIMDAGYELTVYNRTKEKAADLIERGAAWGMVALIFWGKNRSEKISLTDRIASRVRGE